MPELNLERRLFAVGPEREIRHGRRQSRIEHRALGQRSPRSPWAIAFHGLYRAAHPIDRANIAPRHVETRQPRLAVKFMGIAASGESIERPMR